MVLKIDVEGSEWDVFSNIEKNLLACFDQILIEFHDLLNVNNKDKVLKSLEKINATHQLVHIHGNNYAGAIKLEGWNLPVTLEATYLNKNKYTFVDSHRFFPTDIDEKNSPLVPELPLGFWNDRDALNILKGANDDT